LNTPRACDIVRHLTAIVSKWLAKVFDQSELFSHQNLIPNMKPIGVSVEKN
jgi:hypothetical protein